MGRIYRHRKYADTNKDLFIWRLRSFKECLEFSKAILPYMPVKQLQVQLMIEFCEPRVGAGLIGKKLHYSDDDWFRYEVMKELNHKGKEVLVK